MHTAPNQVEWGKRIEALRGDRQQDEVATAAGMSQSNLSRIERGLVTLTKETAVRLADALGVEPSEIWNWPTEVPA